MNLNFISVYPSRSPDKTYSVFSLDPGCDELNKQVESGEIEGYDWTINYDDTLRVYYEVSIWLRFPASNELLTA